MPKGRELSRLVPGSVAVSLDGSEPVLVARTADENKILNYFVAAQIRDMLQKSIKRYADDGDKPTPRELRDLAEAGRALAQFSAELYAGDAVAPEPKRVEEAPSGEDLNFDEINGPKSSEGDQPAAD